MSNKGIKEGATLNEVKRWACNTWKVAGSPNVFAMNDGMFLFELFSKKIAEHVLTATWSLKKMNLSLEWWNPTTGWWPEEITRDWVWIRILGRPLCLWSQNILEQIREQFGGYIETEEGTSLQNHLHCARIKVKGDGKLIPPEI